MIEHAEVLNVLLSHSRGLLDDKGVDANDGFQVYILDLPGLDFIIEAKRTSKIGYTYIIKFYDRRFKVYTNTPPATPLLHLIPKPIPLPSIAAESKTKLPKTISRTSIVPQSEVVTKRSRGKTTRRA